MTTVTVMTTVTGTTEPSFSLPGKPGAPAPGFFSPGVRRCYPLRRRRRHRSENTLHAIPRRGAARRRAALRGSAIPGQAHPHADAAPGGKRGRRDDPHRRPEDEREHGAADPDREPARRGRLDRRG